MENNNLSRDTLMLRGLGAASFASASAFIIAMLLKNTDIFFGIIYALTAVCAVPVFLMLISVSVKDIFTKLLTFLLTGAAFCFIFVRVGFISALSRDIKSGILDRNMIENAGICGLIITGAVIIAAVTFSVLLNKNDRYRSFIEKTDGFQQKMSVPSIAAAFICLAAASMIYG